eukprot:1192918-Prorocentrum_minimum.AAC.1
MADSANKNEKERKKNSAVYPQPDGVQPIQITYLKMISKLLALPPSVELPTTVCVIGDKQGTAVQPLRTALLIGIRTNEDEEPLLLFSRANQRGRIMQVLSAMATTTTTTTITTTSVGARRRSLRVVASSSSGHADGGARPRCRHPKPPAFAAKRGVIII